MGNVPVWQEEPDIMECFLKRKLFIEFSDFSKFKGSYKSLKNELSSI